MPILRAAEYIKKSQTGKTVPEAATLPENTSPIKPSK